ncbi:polyprenyl synthetase family protein [Candidatus Parvarchaeota archaeon]|nr:polyprenyl synthetase family protein [Candidatus Parvarchaeota archaeon]
MDIVDEISANKNLVEAQMLKTIPKNKKPKEVYGLIWDFLGRGGKRFRPMMCLLSCEAVGGEFHKALPVAASLELFHNFTLIHDDIEDNSQMRRGKPCLHISYGLPLALNAGDGLFMASWKALFSLDAKPEKIIEIANVLYSSYVSVLEGQAIELNWHANNLWEIKPEDYVHMVSGKSGALIGGACKSGCLVGEGSKNQADKIYKYGVDVGVAFQIQDDILNIVGDEKKYKKEIGGDIVEGKRTLMVLDLLSKCSESQATRMRNTLDSKKASKEDIKLISSLMADYGSLTYAADYARRLVVEAKKNLDCLPKNHATQKLYDMADYLINREF